MNNFGFASAADSYTTEKFCILSALHRVHGPRNGFTRALYLVQRPPKFILSGMYLVQARENGFKWCLYRVHEGRNGFSRGLHSVQAPENRFLPGLHLVQWRRPAALPSNDPLLETPFASIFPALFLPKHEYQDLAESRHRSRATNAR